MVVISANQLTGDIPASWAIYPICVAESGQQPSGRLYSRRLRSVTPSATGLPYKLSVLTALPLRIHKKTPDWTRIAPYFWSCGTSWPGNSERIAIREWNG